MDPLQGRLGFFACPAHDHKESRREVRLLPATLLVILVDGYRRHDWLLDAVNRRVREEVAKLGILVNEQKSRVVYLERDESFTFLGFDFRWVRSLRGVWRPQYTPTCHKRRELLQKLREVFRRHQSQPVGRLIHEVNVILAGWINYFRIGQSRRHFNNIRDWVEKKVRRHMARAGEANRFRLEKVEYG